MFYNLGKKIFKILINFLHFIQVVLIFLSFFIILYWLFELGKAPFIAPFTPFFDSIKNFVHIFYQRTVTVDQATVDFSFLIATFIALIIVAGLKYLIEFTKDAEKKYDKIHNAIKKRTEDLLNITLEQEYLMTEYKNNKFLLLIQFSALNMAKDSFFHKDSNVGLEEKQKEALLSLADELGKELEFQRKFLNDGLLLYFDSFKNVDKTLSTIEKIVLNLKRKYHAERWQINSIISIDTYAHDNEVLNKIRSLIMLVRLGIKDKIVCMSTFKQRYSINKTQKYQIETQGVYIISDIEENVFVLRN